MVGRIVIDDVLPIPGGSERPARALVGEQVDVSASIWVEDEQALAAAVLVRGPREARRVAMSVVDGDSHHAIVVPDEPGLWTVRIEAWTEPWLSWEATVRGKLAANLGAPELDDDFELGARLLERVAYRPDRRGGRDVLLDAADGLRAQRLLLCERVALALSDRACCVMRTHPVRARVTRSRTYQLRVERGRAGFGAWYELGTFAGAIGELERVAGMGFDVVWLPPMHPEPGSLVDFDAFANAARERGVEVALELAPHCAPGHPWLREHPELFRLAPQSVVPGAAPQRATYPLDFDRDPSGLRAEVLRVVGSWLAHGVRIFRIRDAHRIPAGLSQWLVATVRELHPDVVFVADAPTNSVRRYGLARMGFSQGTTPFADCADKAAFTALGMELVSRAAEFRPQLSVPEPSASLATLAATIGPTWSIHAGPELGPWLTRLNEIRAAHPAFAQLRTLRFHPVDTEALIAYSKVGEAGADIVLCVVNLDGTWAQEGVVRWDFAAIGLDPRARYTVFDEVTGELYEWGEAAYVKLDPNRATAHICSVSGP